MKQKPFDYEKYYLNSSVNAIGEHFNDLDLYFYQNVKTLPKTLKVVNGNLKVRDCKLEKLPDNLTVKGDLIIERNQTLKHLPKKLVVYHNLTLRDCAITQLPEDMKVYYSIMLNHSNVQKLPDNLIVEISLNICNTNITKLPNNLKVKSNLYLNKHIRLEDIKEDLNLQVFGEVYSPNFTFEQFVEHMENERKFGKLRKKLPEFEGIL